MPSIAPAFIAMSYRGVTYAPLCIESISKPIVTPVDSTGHDTECSLSISLSTHTAIDVEAWRKFSFTGLLRQAG